MNWRVNGAAPLKNLTDELLFEIVGWKEAGLLKEDLHNIELLDIADTEVLAATSFIIWDTEGLRQILATLLAIVCNEKWTNETMING